MSRVAVVTGSNKGIGFAIVKQLLQAKSADVVYLTSRDESRGADAVKELKKMGLDAAYHKLDIDSPSSASEFAAFLKEKHGGIDVLVNNAAMAFKAASTAPVHVQAEETNKTNYFGTLSLCQRLCPLVRDGGRVVFVSSQAGHMAYAKMSAELQKKFDDPSLSVEGLSELINAFVAATKAGDHEAKGWPSWTYGVSKTGVTALTRILQRDYDAANPGNDVIYAACCPGYVDTDMTSHKGNRTPDEGADTPFFLATLPAKSDAARGQFWFDRKLRNWAPNYQAKW